MSIRPKLRKHVIVDMTYTLVKAMEERALEGELLRSCINCSAFDEAAEFCKKYGARPPARVIALGCDGHEDHDEIPF